MRARWDFQRVLGSVVIWTCVAKKVMNKLQKLWKNGAQEPQIEAKIVKINEKSFLRPLGAQKSQTAFNFGSIWGTQGEPK